MNEFVRVTKGECGEGKQNAVIMGRKTWLSIPAKYRPLKGRINIVLSSSSTLQSELPDSVIAAKSLKEAIEIVNKADSIHETFIIGGSSVYKEAFDQGVCDRIYITRIQASFEGDTFIDPPNPDHYALSDKYPTKHFEEHGVEYDIQMFEKV